MILYRQEVGEHRLLYIVHACAVKGVLFKNTRPLKECARK